MSSLDLCDVDLLRHEIRSSKSWVAEIRLGAVAGNPPL